MLPWERFGRLLPTEAREFEIVFLVSLGRPVRITTVCAERRARMARICRFRPATRRPVRREHPAFPNFEATCITSGLRRRTTYYNAALQRTCAASVSKFLKSPPSWKTRAYLA